MHEKNAKIAGFMGYEYIPFSKEEKRQPGWWAKDALYQNEKIPKVTLGRTHKDLRYHQSYDWLMKVIDKIEDLGYRVIINTNYVSIHTDKTNWSKADQYVQSMYKGRLDCMYNAVLDFIDWYNSIKKNEN